MPYGEGFRRATVPPLLANHPSATSARLLLTEPLLEQAPHQNPETGTLEKDSNREMRLLLLIAAIDGGCTGG
jgi:hypothetical protein